MPDLVNLLANALVILGAGILIGALVPVRHLIRQLPPGRMRRNWYLLNGLIFVFIAGYLGYALGPLNRRADLPELVVPAVFFFGACFVWLLNSLSFQTALDLGRVATLEQENITDPLMGIYNRRYLERRLDEEVARGRRYGLPLSILLVDIDHFKRVNDTYGHQVGDLVLNHLGKLIADTVRKSDVVARYGGEEVFVIAASTPASSAARLAERLRHVVEFSALAPSNAQDDRQAVPVTVSIGVAGLGPGIGDTRALVESADEALYRAKRDGRNRVIVNDNARPLLEDKESR